jgi:rod shape-determining protein MreD
VRIARVFAVALGSVALQVALARYAVGGRFVFDVALVGVVYVALQSGAVAGMLAGTVAGLLQDVASGAVVGLGGLVKTLVGYAAGVLGTRFVVAKAHARALIVAAATLVHGLLTAGLQAVMTETWWPRVAWADMLEAIVINALVGWLAFRLAEWVPGAAARGRSRRRSSLGRRQW